DRHDHHDRAEPFQAGPAGEQVSAVLSTHWKGIAVSIAAATILSQGAVVGQADFTTLQRALARIEVKKTYTDPGVQSGSNYGTGIVIAADCATVYAVTAAHLLRPDPDKEANFVPDVFAYLYVNRAVVH